MMDTSAPPEVLACEQARDEAGPVGPAAARVLYVPEHLVERTWHELRATSDWSVEGVVLWAGPAPLYWSPVQVVTTVMVPHQRVDAGRYELPPAAVREMGRTLREQGLVNIAQLHTHPHEWVGHSRWDDRHAFSQREGALSLVWPHYGHSIAPLNAWGVHEYRAGRWVQLNEVEASARVRVLPSGVSLRKGVEWMCTTSEEQQQDSDGSEVARPSVESKNAWAGDEGGTDA